MTETFSRHLDHTTFETNYANIAQTVSGGFSALPDPSDPDYESQRMNWNNKGNNVDLGRTAVFNKDDTKFRWGFEISAQQKPDKVTDKPAHNHGTQHSPGDITEAHIIFNDRINRRGASFEQVNTFTDVLSVGKFGGYDTKQIPDGDPFKWHNDDFGIKFTSGPDLYAFAFEIVNNQKVMNKKTGELRSYAKESVKVFNSTGKMVFSDEKNSMQPLIPGYYDDSMTPLLDEGLYKNSYDNVQFLGFVSDKPLTGLLFNEDSRSDNIGIKNLMFAGNVAPVPLPAGVWLLVSGLIALFSLGKKKCSDHQV